MCIRAYNLHASVRGALFLKTVATFVVLSGCLLRHSFLCAQFRVRMKNVEDYMNSAEFSRKDGRGLLGLAKDLRSRCEEVVKRQGERIPK